MGYEAHFKIECENYTENWGRPPGVGLQEQALPATDPWKLAREDKINKQPIALLTVFSKRSKDR